tara:strand:- start:195 stop:740 length:546 start_codon:yes stop_codon:yes gene_type:complete
MALTKVTGEGVGAVTNQFSSANMPAGSSLQVVSTTKTDTFSTTAGGASPTDITGLSVSITPSSTSNKVLVMFSVTIGAGGLSTTGIRLMRGSTAISIGDAAGDRPRMTANGAGMSANNWNAMTVATSFLDSPSSTSAVTYKLQMVGNGQATNYVNRTGRDSNNTNEDYRATSHITVMEIAG